MRDPDMADPWPADVILEGHHVRIEPLEERHGPDLSEAAADGDLHLLWYTSVPEPQGIAEEIARRRALRAAGSMQPFALCDPRSGAAVGMTTYMNIDAANRRVEIGSTWMRRAVQRTALNTEAKFLLLRHAFETLDCIAVEFRTHVLNQQSRRAIERLGARLDGILRAHQILPNGTLRDTAVYSITAADWPTIRAHLTFQLDRER
ncbi:MAG: GNAT family protein [Pseudomonadota bacterium]